jgi:DNA-binding beta-propeller fold protein YncE
VTESIDGTIRRVDVATRSIETVAGLAAHPGWTDGVDAAARFAAPAGLAADRDGNVFVADHTYALIRQLIPASRQVTTVAGRPDNVGFDDGIGADAQFRAPVDLVADSIGHLFVVEDVSFTVRRIDLATRMVSTLAGLGGSIGSVDGVGSAARFWMPAGICYDGAQKLYVADGASSRMRSVDVQTAEVQTVAGPGDRGYPLGIAYDGAGQLYVANSGTHTIARIALTTQAYTTVAGVADEPGDIDGDAATARLNRPTDLVLDGRGHLFFAEPDNHLVRRIDLASGAVTTFAGTRGLAGVKIGPLPARLNTPSGVAVLPSGDLVIADTVENVVLLAR